MIEGSLRSVLVSDSTINALIAGRAYPAHSVQEPTFPFVTYQRISADRILSHTGSGNVVEAIFQFSCWGSKPADVYALAKLIAKKFNGFKGIVLAEDIMLTRTINEVEFYDEDAASYQVAIDISVAYRE